MGCRLADSRCDVERIRGRLTFEVGGPNLETMESSRNLPWHRGVNTLARREAWLALDKPTGVRVHPNQRGADRQALLPWPFDPADEVFAGPEGQKLWLTHRLDAPTSGVLVVAETEAAARQLRAAFADRSVKKVYWAVCKGRPPKAEAIWRDRLAVVRAGAGVRAVTGRGESAETRMVLRNTFSWQGRSFSLLELHPRTGRTHQLRVQAASRHLPLIGDATYGDFRTNRDVAKGLRIKRLCLHAHRLTVPIGSRAWTVESPLPPEFAAW